MRDPLLIDGVSTGNTRAASQACSGLSPEPLCPDEALQRVAGGETGALEDTAAPAQTSVADTPKQYAWGHLPSTLRIHAEKSKAALDNPSAPAPASGEVAEVELSGSDLVNSILEGTKWGDAKPGTGTTLTFSFKTEDTMSIAPSNTSYAKPGWTLSDAQKEAVRGALAEWAKVANIRFKEVEETEDTQGDLRFGGTDNTPAQRTAEAAPLVAGDAPENGDVWLGKRFHDLAQESTLAPGSYEFMALMHEIGHTLGLKHPHHTSPDNALLTPREYDNQRQTLMSYTLDYSVSPFGPQPLDIDAIQYLYGPNIAHNTGDTDYQFEPDTPVFQSIWDAGGVNTLDASNQTTSVKLDLTEGGRSSIGALIEDNNFGATSPSESNDYLTVASGTLIQNAIGSPQDDYFWGSSEDNSIEGGAGDDMLYGNGGRDRAMYSVTDKPEEAAVVEDDTLPDFWHLVDGEGRNLLEIRRAWDGNSTIVEDVRAKQDIPKGQARLGQDVLVDIEVIDWSTPTTKKP